MNEHILLPRKRLQLFASMPRRTQVESDSDNDAPEVVTLSSSKKALKSKEIAVKDAKDALRIKRKRENQERDRELKAAKEQRRREKEPAEEIEEQRARKRTKRSSEGKQKARIDEESADEVDPIEARMLRSMREAADESDDMDDMDEGNNNIEAFNGNVEGSLGARGSDEGSDDEGSDNEGSDNGESFDEEEDEEEFSYDEGEEQEDLNIQASSKHLPDHLFSTLSSSTSKHLAKKVDSSRLKPKASKKNKICRTTSKDVLVGYVTRQVLIASIYSLLTVFRSSRTVRILANNSTTTTTSHTLPPARVSKFLRRNLQLRKNHPLPPALKKKTGSKARKIKEWERRPGPL